MMTEDEKATVVAAIAKHPDQRTPDELTAISKAIAADEFWNLIPETTVFGYFNIQLGRDPNEKSLRDLRLNSECGQDCKAVIDAAKKFLEVTDRHPDVIEPVLQAANAACEIFWLG